MSSFQYATQGSSQSLLTINGGSSSIKFAAFEKRESLNRTWCGKVERLGQRDATLDIINSSTLERVHHGMGRLDLASAIEFLIDRLEERVPLQSFSALAHRVVHGLKHTQHSSSHLGYLQI